MVKPFNVALWSVIATLTLGIDVATSDTELSRKTLKGISKFSLVGDFADTQSAFGLTRDDLETDIHAQLRASASVWRAVDTEKEEEFPKAYLLFAVRATCTDTSAAALPPLPPYNLPPCPSCRYIYSQEQKAYIEAYKAYAIARARAAGEKTQPIVCAVRVSVGMEQMVRAFTEPPTTWLATTWEKQELLLVSSGEAARATRSALAVLTKAFIEAYLASNRN